MSAETPAETGPVVRVAAAGDIHCREERREEIATAFAALRGAADLVLLAGDLTTYGEPEEARVLADAVRELEMPIYAVLGNHDWHMDHAAELTEVLRGAGVHVLERETATLQIDGVDVGIVGAKGFVGGFPGSHLPDFGEPLLREVYREGQRDVEALDRGLREIALCQLRFVLLHYAPTDQTLVGEDVGIMAFLGTDRLAAPIAEHEPTLAVHGHAHAGRFEGKIGTVPVYNVSVPVLGRDFEIFELRVLDQAAPIH